MNDKRIREMAYKTCFESGFDGPEHFVFYHTDLQKFAELIVRECMDQCEDMDDRYRIGVSFGV
jgi:hypothetical protein